MKPIHVVAGIIWNIAGTHILISRRPDHLHRGGYWEFPGGKVESGETGTDALKRELVEELGIKFMSSRFFRQVLFDYPEKRIQLDFYEVFDVEGEVSANEGQAWRWVSLADLHSYRFPEANLAIVDALTSSAH